jgi:hypothetical protein
MTWMRTVSVLIALLTAAVTVATWGAWPWLLTAGQAVLLVAGLRGAWLVEDDPSLGFWLLVLAAVGTPLFLILVVPAALAWRRSARRPQPTPPATAR